MAESVENVINTSGGNNAPPPSGYDAYMSELKGDVKAVLNNAVWNMALLYPFYYSGLDGKYFNQFDDDFIGAAKVSALASTVTEGQKMIRSTLSQAGVSNAILYPFGQRV